MTNLVQENMRILDLLAQGIKPTQVMTMIGCKPEYLKMLVASEEFMSALEAKAMEYRQVADENQIVSSKYFALEHDILQKIHNDLPTADFRDAIRALEVVSNRQDKHLQRTKDSQAPAVINTINQVVLNLPNHAIPEYTLNSNKEVVMVGNKPMSAMSSANVVELFHALKEGQTVVQEIA